MKNTLLALLIIGFMSVNAQRVMFPFELKSKWGYMNVDGKIILAATFDYADDFVGNTAIVAVRNQPCVIDNKGNYLIDTGTYQYISRFGNGLAAATDYSNHKFYINLKGKKVITLDADIYETRPFSEGVAVVSKKLDEHETKFGKDIATLGYRFAYIDTTGKLLTNFIFEDADDIQNGLARVKQGTKFGLVNNKGEWVIQPTYQNIGTFNEQKAVVDVNGKYGYINKNGALIIKPIFDYAYNFSEGLAGVWIKGKFGFIDETGELVIPATHEQIKPFSEGKAAVLKDGKWGFIDKKGTWVLRNVFDNASVFAEGKCAVLVKRNWGFIDAQGALVIPADFDAAGSFHDGIADVVYRDINFYINTTGQLLPIIEKK